MEQIVTDFQLTWNWMMDNLVYINLVCSIVIIFFQRRDPKSVWGWLLLLYFVPILGIVFYVVFGQDFHKSKMFHIKEIEDEINSTIHRQEDSILRREFEEKQPSVKRYADLVLYNLQSAGAVFTDDNDVTIYEDGNEKFNALIEDLKKAEHYIHLQYYIIREDELFTRIKDVLIERAKNGVEVRVLYDAMGCRSTGKKLWKSLRAHGIQVAEFFPALFGRLQLRLNYRNHRKIVIIDGKVGYVGGFNVGREYLGLDRRFGYWRDTHLRITGSSVVFLQLRFILDWNYAAKENLLKKRQYFEVPDDAIRGKTGIQIVSSGPDSTYENIKNNYLKLITRSRDSIYIQTPYFIPDETVYDALRVAALSGVDVKIMIPCKPDHPFVYWATYSYIGDMIAAGAKCYTYDNGFLHAKGLISDGKALSFGTANMDIRSFKLNFEVNATIYDEDTAAKMQEIFMEDLSKSTEITAYVYGQRSLLVRIKEQICRLFSPVL